MKQLVIKEMESGQRLDKFLGKYLKEAPKSFIYKMLRKKNITLNGKKADGSEKLKTEDVVKLFFSEETLEKFCGQVKQGEKTALDIVYEDEQVLFVNNISPDICWRREALPKRICGLSVPVCATVWTEIPAVWWRPGKPYRVCRNCPGVFRREVCTNII